MAEDEPISPSHLVLIISSLASRTDCLEQVLHKLNVTHRYAMLQSTPTAKDFWWDVCELNPDVVIIFGGGFPDHFIAQSLITLHHAQYEGVTIVVDETQKRLPSRIVHVTNGNDVTQQLEKIIIEKLKLSLRD